MIADTKVNPRSRRFNIIRIPNALLFGFQTFPVFGCSDFGPTLYIESRVHKTFFSVPYSDCMGVGNYIRLF